MTATSPPVRYDPYRPRFVEDPYPMYARLREEAPVHHEPLLGCWVLSRYDDVADALRDPRLSSTPIPEPLDQLPPALRAEEAVIREHFARWLVTLDPPDHTRLRSLLNRAFTPRMVERLRPRAQALADRLVDDAIGLGEVDLLHQVAGLLPAMIIADLMGVSSEMAPQLCSWGDDLVAAFGSGLSARRRSERNARAARTIREFSAFVLEEAEVRRRRPGEDLLSALVQAGDAGQVLSDADLVSICSFLLTAGHETTGNLVAIGTAALLDQPDRLAELRAGADDALLVASAVEELLRYVTPAQATSRRLLADMEIHGTLLEEGCVVMLLMASANRDPRRFDRPDVLDLRRPDNRHLAFSGGPHFCVGAPLARIEAQVLFATLFRKVARIELATDRLSWVVNPLLRTLESLPVRLQAA